MRLTKWISLILITLSFTFEANAASSDIGISEIPPSGLIINMPGTYVFENDITWTPVADGAAILIQSENVTLDLKDHKLINTSPSYYTTGITAVLSENLIIKNGTLLNFSYRGVDCTACAKIQIRDITVDRLSVENTAVFTVPVGILVSASLDAFIYQCTVKNIDVRTASCAAIQITATTLSRIWDCTIKNLINRDGACTGIGHVLSDLAEVRSCTLDGLKTEFIDNLNTEGHTAIGLIPFLSTNISILDCEVTNVTGSCDDAHGISVFECTNAEVKNCQVSNILDGAGPRRTGAKTTGIEVYGSDIAVIDCKVNYISAINPQNRQATGFSCAQGARIQFINCEVKNVKVYNEKGIEDTSKGYGTGFGWAPDPRIVEPAVNVLYEKCTAKYCQVGFDSWFHIDSIWNEIYSKCNEIAILDLDDSAQRTISCDACSECGCTFPGCFPAPFFITITNIAKNNKFINPKIKDCD